MDNTFCIGMLSASLLLKLREPSMMSFLEAKAGGNAEGEVEGEDKGDSASASMSSKLRDRMKSRPMLSSTAGR